MNQSWIGVLVVAAVAVLILFLSKARQKQIQPFLDAFAEAFCEIADHLMPSGGVSADVCTETLDGGGLAMRPKEEQPESIRELLDQGVDEYVLERVRRMFAMRQKAQEYLSSINLIGKKINAVLNSTYDLTNVSLSIVDDPNILRSQKHLEALHYYLHKQAYIRNVTLAAVVSEECKQKIAVG